MVEDGEGVFSDVIFFISFLLWKFCCLNEGIASLSDKDIVVPRTLENISGENKQKKMITKKKN